MILIECWMCKVYFELCCMERRRGSDKFEVYHHNCSQQEIFRPLSGIPSRFAIVAGKYLPLKPIHKHNFTVVSTKKIRYHYKKDCPYVSWP